MRKAIPGYTLIPENGYYKARKIGITGSRVKKHPNYAITRKHAAEFAYAAKIGKLIRGAVREKRQAGKGAGRLTSVLLKAIKTDSENALGERGLLYADLSSLVGFDFNSQHPWLTCCHCQVAVTRSSGRQVQVQIPAFTPAIELTCTGQAGYCSISCKLMTIEVATGAIATATATTGLHPHNLTLVNSCCFSFDTSGDNGHVYILCGCLDWFQIVNGRAWPLSQYATVILDAWSTGCTKNCP